jgi:hypothetical protein
MPAPEDRLLTPRTGIARRFGPHPTGLAPLITQQDLQEPTRRGGHALLGEQRPHPRLHLTQR